ncbi:MAG: peptidase S8 and S53 subtilisin kexin sedolisin, partial [Saprospiraceae bacterium]|nr:peptidase S8 and S53 subtilisin kexin sedolisin [Saprospiraceae bacterium]
MDKLTVKSGKGELRLRKSRKLVGLKTREEAVPGSIAEEVYKDLGGFRVVTLETAEENLDSQLDELRQSEDVKVGTHVYYAEGSNKPLVPTGDLYITFS